MKIGGFHVVLSLSKDPLGFVGAFLADVRFAIVKSGVHAECPYAS
jgi:hypothetical protein